MIFKWKTFKDRLLCYRIWFRFYHVQETKIIICIVPNKQKFLITILYQCNGLKVYNQFHGILSFTLKLSIVISMMVCKIVWIWSIFCILEDFWILKIWQLSIIASFICEVAFKIILLNIYFYYTYLDLDGLVITVYSLYQFTSVVRMFVPLHPETPNQIRLFNKPSEKPDLHEIYQMR